MRCKWHWYWRQDCASGDPLEWGADDLQRPHLKQLHGYAGDSVYFGFFQFRGGHENVFSVYINGYSDSLHFDPTIDASGSWYVSRGALKDSLFPFNKVVWGGSNRRFEGYTMAYQRRYFFEGSPFYIFPSQRGQRQGYRITGVSGVGVVKIIDGVGVALFQTDSEGRFSDSIGWDEDVQYLVFARPRGFSESSLLSYDGGGQGVVQNLATADGKSPEYLILSPDAVLPAALEYRDYRISEKRAMSLDAAVVRVADIYRDFSGGRVTPVAIRDFLRFAVNHWAGGRALSNPLRYVVLLGDGHFNVRMLPLASHSELPPNLIPPYEDFQFETDVACSDDFFVKFARKDQDGQDGANSRGSGLLALAIGRIPISNLAEARQYLDKVKNYEEPTHGGDWRSRVILAADDNLQFGAPNNGLDPIGTGHTNDTERLGGTIQKNEPGILLDKVYLLDYAANASHRKPEAAQDLLDLMNRGAVMVNFVGHGAFNQWADEVLLYTNDALPRLKNVGRTPLLNSFSCTVGRFDNLQNDVLTEQFVRNGATGAIAGISSTRESFPNHNIPFADAIYSRLFPDQNATNITSVGVALQQAKNSRLSGSTYNDSKYALLGDPAILIRRPKLKVSLENYPDTLRALDCGKIAGKVEGGSGKGFARILVLSGTTRKD